MKIAYELEKRQDFYFPVNDDHFSGEEYQKPHRIRSLQFVDDFDVALDVGSHVGTWAVDLCNMFNKVYCFEPIEIHRECLTRNLSGFPSDRFEILPYALGAENDVEIALEYAAEGNSGTASITTDVEQGEYKAVLKTLDSFDFEKIDYIKVDVEGFELQFLKGASETIKRTKPVINIEIKNTCERFGTTQLEIANYLVNDLGMDCVGRTVADYIFIYHL